MALKQLVDVGEKFPTLKRARLGAAPPVEDVLDNVGAPELAPPQSQTAAVAQPEQPAGDDAHRANPAAKKKERTTKRVGQGVHKGAGTDARRYRKSGRTEQFGARVKPAFAEGIKQTASEKNLTIGELLEEMRSIYDSISAISADKKIAVRDLLSEFAKKT